MRHLIACGCAVMCLPLLASAGAQVPRDVASVAGCYVVLNGIAPLLPDTVHLDTTRVQPGVPSNVAPTYGVRGREPLDSTSDRWRPPAARLEATWFFVGEDSISIFGHDKFTRHQLRLSLAQHPLQGVQKYQTDAFDPDNLPKWVPVTVRRVDCGS